MLITPTDKLSHQWTPCCSYPLHSITIGEEVQGLKRARPSTTEATYADVLLGTTPGAILDFKAFALTIEQLYCTCTELPSRATLANLVLEADYDSDHDRGALATGIEALLAQRMTKDPLPDVHLLFSEWAESLPQSLADDVEAQRIASVYGRQMMGIWFKKEVRARAEDENRIAQFLDGLALMAHNRGRICANITELNAQNSKLAIDSQM